MTNVYSFLYARWDPLNDTYSVIRNVVVNLYKRVSEIINSTLFFFSSQYYYFNLKFLFKWCYIGRDNMLVQFTKRYITPMYGRSNDILQKLEQHHTYIWYSTIKTCTLTRCREWKKERKIDWWVHVCNVIYPNTRDGSCRFKFAIYGYGYLI